MSRQFIQQYYSKVDKVIQYGGIKNETAIRGAFHDLLNQYAEKRNLLVVEECPVQGTKGRNVIPDGVLKNSFRLDLGIWESKDEADTLDDEIDKKHKKGYPFYNALFEDSRTAVLFQYGEKVGTANVREPDQLDKLLDSFLNYKNEYIEGFEKALAQFRNDIPTILETLRERIDTDSKENTNFIAARTTYLELCKAEINPDITLADVREMMIQHILTSDIFNKVFDDSDFHRHNTIAAELEKLTGILFSYAEKRNLLISIEHYYDAINSAAASISDHHEKQKFLKSLYENFYKVYNPKAADRLGVVYTPNEIVKFMIESTDYLLNKHFGKTLADKNVDILDPATGTGTFICDIIERIPKQQLLYKYKNELHANEVAILPYYISNLNIEYTFKQKMGIYEEFTNLCFVDTLDNTAPLAYSGKQHTMFGLSSENTNRIKRQNEKKISVIIGNPPYNANQKNWNDYNKNREYPQIDKRIKDTYIRESNAQKTKVYDMFARFFRWSSDRIDKDGIICFITNNAYINKKTYDGFRKTIHNEFQNAYVIDLGGDIRELSGKDGIFLNEDHTIFGQAAAVGIAIAFLIKDSSRKSDFCDIEYLHPTDIRATRNEKLDYLRANKIQNYPFHKIVPDKNNNWINLANNDFEGLIALKNKTNPRNQLFAFTFLGVSTNRDDWVYDFNDENLLNKVKFFEKTYNKSINQNEFDNSIKWSRDLRNKFSRGLKFKLQEESIKDSSYRPFVKQKFFAQKIISDVLTQNHYEVFGSDLIDQNIVITFASYERRPFAVLAVNNLTNLNYFGDPANSLPLYRYDSSGQRIENITDWGLQQFFNHYAKVEVKNVLDDVLKEEKRLSTSKSKKYSAKIVESLEPGKAITKESIFHYCYAVLHNPAYRKKYELNLKREFPRIPFYDDFWKWSAWGKELMDLHINYETAMPYPLKEITSDSKSEQKKKVKELFSRVEEPQALYAHKPKVKVKLRADKEAGSIEIDELTMLTGIPKEAWEYKLGNRSALEWILDQYKEKKPKDPTIAEKFNTYRFADYKEKVIELLKRVTTVSLQTVKVVREMEKKIT